MHVGRKQLNLFSFILIVNGLIWREKLPNGILLWFTFTSKQTKLNRLNRLLPIINGILRKFACICEDFLFYSDTAHF